MANTYHHSHQPPDRRRAHFQPKIRSDPLPRRLRNPQAPHAIRHRSHLRTSETPYPRPSKQPKRRPNPARPPHRLLCAPPQRQLRARRPPTPRRPSPRRRHLRLPAGQKRPPLLRSPRNGRLPAYRLKTSKNTPPTAPPKLRMATTTLSVQPDSRTSSSISCRCSLLLFSGITLFLPPAVV